MLRHPYDPRQTSDPTRTLTRANLVRRGRRALAGALRRAVEPLESRQLLTGTLDPSFGTGGRVVTDFPGTPFDEALGPALQSDGKILAQTGTGAFAGRLVRYTANGQLDATFGSGGVLNTTHQPGALAVRGDDKIVVVTQNSPDTILISRYTASGQIDTTFGGGAGHVTQSVFGGSQTSTKLISRILVRPDNGRIYVVGSVDPFDSGLYQFAISAYNADGTPYQEFGDNPSDLPNTTLTSFGYTNVLADAVLTADGHIDAVGTLTVSDSHHPDVQQDFAVARYDEHGVLDATFSPGGNDGSGKLLIDFGDYPRTGSFDTNDAFDQARSATLDPAGNLLISGTSCDPSDDDPFFTALARVKPDGTLDPAFGPGGADGDGLVSLPLSFPAANFSSNQVAVLGTGKILLATDTNIGAGDLTLSLLNANGSPDTTFGADGTLPVDFGPSNDFHGALLVQAGKPLLAGGIWPADGTSASLAMARYLIGEAQTPFGGTPLALPGTLQFENFDDGGEGVAYHDLDAANVGGAYRNTGVDIQAIPSGGYNVGFARAGEWTEYTLDVPAAQAGSYNVAVRYASLRGGGKFHLEVDGQPVTATLTAPATGNWQGYQTLAIGPIFFGAGRHVLRLAMDANDVTGYVANFDSATFSRIPGGPQTPFGGKPIAVGDTGPVELENFDNGGEGVAYHDTDAVNQGGAYRNTGVDIEAIPLAANGRSGFAIDFAKAGEWTEYTLDVAQSAPYSATLWLASLRGGGRFHLELDGRPITGVITAPSTGNWQRFLSMGLPTFDLPAGQHVLRLAMDANDSTGYVGNFDQLGLSRLGFSATKPFHGTPFQPNLTIEAEDFDIGGEGFSYHDTDAQNLGAADYRPGSGVDIEPFADGYNVGFAKAGEWLQYTVDGPSTAGTLSSAEVNIASLKGGGRFHLEVDGQTVATFTAPKTANWQAYATLTTPRNINIPPGTHKLRLVMDANDSTGYVANFNWIRLVS